MNPNRYLTFSLTLNVALCGAVAFMIAGKSKSAPERIDTEPKQAAIQTSREPERREAQPVPFQWSQVEADDYPSYISKLRSIGCPERTIREIIAADVADSYDQKIQDLQSNGLTGESLTQASERLKTEQAGLMQTIFPALAPTGVAASATSGVSLASTTYATYAATNTAVSSQQSPPPVKITIPLAYLQPDPSLGLDANQLNSVKTLQNQFVAAIGGPNQNPYDPAYANNWMTAQENSDEIYHSQFGDAAFNYMLQQRFRTPSK